MIEELKPCPFCGGEAFEQPNGFFKGDLSNPTYHECVCHDCEATIREDTRVEAISAWNTRATPKVKALEWEGDGHWCSGPDEGWMEEANTAFGWGYSIEFGRDGNFKADSAFNWSEDGFETPDEAKAAAQSDYKRRILSALEREGV